MKHMQLLDKARVTVPPVAAVPPAPQRMAESGPIYEHGQYSSASAVNRSTAFTLTLAFHALVLGGFFIHRGASQVKLDTPALAVFDIAPPAAPPEPSSEVPPGPQQVEKEMPDFEPVEQDIELPVIRLASDNPISVQPQLPDPGPPVEQTSAPENSPVPPAPQLSSAETSWQARLLAHLEKFRRYPAGAKARREQGVAYIRFRMDREGRLVSAQLSRSSGSRRLDKAALETIRRAAPFPKPPQDWPDKQLELTAPVEFFIR
ncbi:hypothetical protein CHN51_07380 [Sphingorhabdus sp. YGSMI21]|nr:hypothetical protein CHN51_07380 [Sphingorhabdus sp. YGSMI21]